MTEVVWFCKLILEAFFSCTEPVSVGGVNDFCAVEFDELLLVVVKDKLNEREGVVIVDDLFPFDEGEAPVNDAFVNDDGKVPNIVGGAFCATVVVIVVTVVCDATAEGAGKAALSCSSAALGNGVTVVLAAIVSFCAVSSCFLSMI